MSFKLTILSFFADPNIAYLLMMLAALGIYLELSNPGLIVPGVVGGISGILAMMSFHMLPITAAGVLLLVGGLILITLEFFVPGFGILGAGGTVSLVLGGIFLVDPVKTDITVSYSILVPVGILFGSIVVLVAFFVLSARKRVVLTGYNAMFGLKAEVLSFNAKKQRGKLAIRGEIWTFTSQDENIELVKGDEVVIKDKEGMILIVNKE